MCDSHELGRGANDPWQNEWRCSWAWRYAHWDWTWQSQSYESATATAGSSNTQREQSQEFVELQAHNPWRELSSSWAPGSDDLDSGCLWRRRCGGGACGCSCAVAQCAPGTRRRKTAAKNPFAGSIAEQTGGTDLLEARTEVPAAHLEGSSLQLTPSPLPHRLACKGSEATLRNMRCGATPASERSKQDSDKASGLLRFCRLIPIVQRE